MCYVVEFLVYVSAVLSQRIILSAEPELEELTMRAHGTQPVSFIYLISVQQKEGKIRNERITRQGR